MALHQDETSFVDLLDSRSTARGATAWHTAGHTATRGPSCAVELGHDGVDDGLQILLVVRIPAVEK
jgi:hypothetical protein